MKSVLVTGTGTSDEPLILDIENPTPLDLQPTPLQPVINPRQSEQKVEAMEVDAKEDDNNAELLRLAAEASKQSKLDV